MKYKFKRSISKKSYAWSLSPIWRYWSREYVHYRGSPKLVYGERYVSLHQAKRNQERWSTWRDQDRHHLAQVECARQRYDLDRVSILPVSWCCGRPGYRIDSVLSRGTLQWVTWSYLCGEFKPLHTWHHHLSWFLFGFSPCWVFMLVVIFMTSPSSSKTDFGLKSCCVFVLEILSVYSWEKFHTST